MIPPSLGLNVGRIGFVGTAEITPWLRAGAIVVMGILSPLPLP